MQLQVCCESRRELGETFKTLLFLIDSPNANPFILKNRYIFRGGSVALTGFSQIDTSVVSILAQLGSLARQTFTASAEGLAVTSFWGFTSVSSDTGSLPSLQDSNLI